MDTEIGVASNKDILKDLDELIREATLSSFNELLSPLLEDEREKQDDMSKRTKALDDGDDASEMDEAEDEDAEKDEDKDKEAAVAAATGKKPEKEEEAEAVIPSEDDIANADVEHIVNMLNMMRSGKSTKDEEVQKDLGSYFDGLDAGEKQALYIMLSGLTQILTADIPGDEAPDPTSVGIKIQAKKKQRDSEVSKPAQKAAAATSSDKPTSKQKSKEQGTGDLPIVVGEVADKTKLRALFRLLGS